MSAATLLGLATDVALSAPEGSAPSSPDDFADATALRDRARALAARLLSRVDPELEEAITAVAATRSFDREVFVYLGTHLDFAVSPAVFRRLTAFSFVLQQPGEERHAIHQLLRRAIALIAPDST